MIGTHNIIVFSNKLKNILWMVTSFEVITVLVYIKINAILLGERQ